MLRQTTGETDRQTEKSDAQRERDRESATHGSWG